MAAFIASLLIATIGLYAGQFVPPAFMVPLSIAELIMIIAAFWLRRKKAVGYLFLFAFTFISGITIFPVVSYYGSQAGAEVILMALGTTFIIFAVMGILGTIMKTDVSFLGSFLLIALLGIVIVWVLNLFMPLNSANLLIISGISAIVFSLYILFDFNQMKHRGISEEMIPLLALNLYLDFINLFTNLLRMLGILENDD
ncbi:Bax inhibitor-1 family protein [Bacillus sp. 1P06AnD]|uniref:Bax inhibitor-1/YccA family protein n=1 Tax=Bacillus sp. 1P06AnD TaxID=3132208 RepID=UPI0039A140C2